MKVNSSLSTPIYEQIVESIKDMIFLGGLREDEKIPSIRDLSTSLIINPNTVSKAYSILERDEAIYAVAGKGFFVNPSYRGKLIKEKRKNIEIDLENIVCDAINLGLLENDVLQIIKNRFERKMEGELNVRG